MATYIRDRAFPIKIYLNDGYARILMGMVDSELAEIKGMNDKELLDFMRENAISLKINEARSTTMTTAIKSKKKMKFPTVK